MMTSFSIVFRVYYILFFFPARKKQIELNSNKHCKLYFVFYLQLAFHVYYLLCCVNFNLHCPDFDSILRIVPYNFPKVTQFSNSINIKIENKIETKNLSLGNLIIKKI